MRGPIECTPCEHEVARLVVEGLTNAEIAEQVGVSKNTVQYHLKELYARLGTSSRAVLIREFLQGNLRLREPKQ